MCSISYIYIYNIQCSWITASKLCNTVPGNMIYFHKCINIHHNDLEPMHKINLGVKKVKNFFFFIGNFQDSNSVSFSSKFKSTGHQSQGMMYNGDMFLILLQTIHQVKIYLSSIWLHMPLITRIDDCMNIQRAGWAHFACIISSLLHNTIAQKQWRYIMGKIMVSWHYSTLIQESASFPDGTKPILETLLAYHQWGPVPFT